jgi:hypothetical protein
MHKEHKKYAIFAEKKRDLFIHSFCFSFPKLASHFAVLAGINSVTRKVGVLYGLDVLFAVRAKREQKSLKAAAWCTTF